MITGHGLVVLVNLDAPSAGPTLTFEETSGHRALRLGN